MATGQEKEIPTDGFRHETAVFNPDGTGIMYVQYPDAGSWRDFIYYAPLSSGLPKKIWDRSLWSWIWDCAPDGKTLLVMAHSDRSGNAGGWRIQELDLDSLSATAFLYDSSLDLWQAHFSHDGRWVTFNATKDKEASRVYLVPFRRKAALPRSEWIAITEGAEGDKPRFSYDDRSIFFRSDRDGTRRIWVQTLGPHKRPDGKPIAVYPLGQSKRAPVISDDDISVGPHLIVFTQVEENGNIWLLEPAFRGR